MNIRSIAAERKARNYEQLSFSEPAIRELIDRVMGRAYSETFVITQLCEANGKDRFVLKDTENGKIKLQATSGVAAAAAVRWYLQERCGSYVGPLTRRLNLPDVPPEIGGTYQNESPFLYRYFFNYCTFGYTCAFWDWTDWEPFLDWLLLSGYNLILNPLGNERVWTNTLRRLGYSLEDARAFLCSPVFYPWQCMLNLSGWGGAAPEHWYDERVELSKRIMKRLNEMGAHVVLPGYSGIVPDDFRKHFPAANLLEQGNWCDFSRPSLVSYEDPLFATVAAVYYEEQTKLFGDHAAYFSVDPFHEGGNSSKVDMGSYGLQCFAAMQQANRDAVWVLQGWTTNPNREMLKALNPENVLIANLKSEVNVDGGDDFAHTPWMYGCVNNFGGRRVPRANLNSQIAGPHRAVSDSKTSMVGLAMLPEGVEVDACAFDVFSDLIFRKENLSAESWQSAYIRHRYGYHSEKLEQAWTLLREKIYLSDTSSTPKESALCARPSLNVSMVTPACGTSDFTYHPGELIPILQAFLQEKDALLDCVSYRMDLSELLRQLVALTAWLPVKHLQDGFRNRNRTLFRTAAEELMLLFDFQCKIMADSPIRTLDENLSRATRYGIDADEKAYFAYQLKLLITSWGDRKASEILHDYACREWSGMLERFYRPRWEHYIRYLWAHFDTGEEDRELDRAYPHFDLEQEFCKSCSDGGAVAAEKLNFSYANEALAFCEKLLSRQKLNITNRKQHNAMELK